MNESNISTPIIALLVHLPLRDLVSLVVTAIELTRRGATCYLVPVTALNDVWASQPDFVLLPHFRPSLEPFARDLVRSGIQFGLLDTEGGVISDFDEYDRTLWRDRELKRRAACVMMWSPKLAEHLIADGHFLPSQVTVTGTPRMDLYRAPWSALATESVAGNADRPLILINTNLPIGNPDVPAASLLPSRIQHYGYSREEILRWRELQLTAIDDFAQMAESLARDFPQCDVILRPHPHEPVATYERKMAALPNLSVQKVGSVHSWIMRAIAVIQSNCTTAIEAGVANKPALTPGWIPVSYRYDVAEQVSDVMGDYEGLRATIGRILSGTYQRPPAPRLRLDEVIQDWFYQVDGESSRRVADCIMASTVQPIKPDPGVVRLCMYGLRHHRPRHLREVSSWLKYILRLPSQLWFRQMRIVAGPNRNHERFFDREEVQRIVSSYWRILGQPPATSVGTRAMRARNGVRYISYSDFLFPEEKRAAV